MFQFGLTWQLRPKNRDSPCFWSPGLWQLHFLKQKPKPLSCRYFHPRHCLYNLFVPWHWHFAISRHGSMTKLNGIKKLLYVVRSKTLFTAHPFNLYVVDYHHLLICFLVCSSVLFFVSAMWHPSKNLDIGESSRTGSNLPFPEVPPLKQTSAEWFWTGLDEFGLPRPSNIGSWRIIPVGG